MKICPECETEFEGKRADAIYCSDKCGNRAWVKANRISMAELHKIVKQKIYDNQIEDIKRRHQDES